MTILSACQSAALRLSQTRPASLFSTTDVFPMEMADLATEAAVDIAKSHDWQALTKLATLTGDGVTASFPLPADYDRMTKAAQIHSKTWQWGAFQAATDLDGFLFTKDINFAGFPGTWQILGGQFQITPVISAAETARFYYITNQIVSGGKTAFTADTDTFLLPERLITLAVIWRWRSQKRLEYAEDMRNFEIALADEIVRESGARPLIVGGKRWRDYPHIAYPGQLGS